MEGSEFLKKPYRVRVDEESIDYRDGKEQMIDHLCMARAVMFNELGGYTNSEYFKKINELIAEIKEAF